MTSAVKGYIKNESDGEIIDKLNLPCGLKGLLASHGFTIDQLLCMESGDIADTLGIDQDAARLIVSAVRQKVDVVDDMENAKEQVKEKGSFKDSIMRRHH